MPTAEELTQLQDSILQKRLAVAEARTSREAQEHDLADAISYQNLQAESARLDLELAEEKARSAALSSGASAPLEAAKAEMEAAVAQQQAQVAAVKAAESAAVTDAAAAADTAAAPAPAATPEPAATPAPAAAAAPSTGGGA